MYIYIYICWSMKINELTNYCVEIIEQLDGLIQ